MMLLQVNMKPYKTYFGGKNGNGTYQTLINLIPKHSCLIIGFTGNCSLLNYMKLPEYTYFYDVDESVIKNWNKILRGITAKNKVMSGINDNFIDALQKQRLGPNSYLWREGTETFIYLDPPYLHSTRGHYRYKYELQLKDHKQCYH